MALIVNDPIHVRLPLAKRAAKRALLGSANLIRRWLLRSGRHVAVKPPKYLKIETTNACQAKCVYCPRDEMTRKIGIMELPLFQKIVDDAVAMGIPSLHVQNYGEPLLDKGLVEKVRYAKQRGMPHVTFFTNGALLEEEISRQLIDAGLDEINVSLDPGTKEMHDRIRLHLFHDDIVRNLETLIRVRRELQAPRPKVTIASVIHAENRGAIDDFIARWSPGVDEMHFQDEHTWGHATEELTRRTAYPCLRLWLTLTVLWDGRVSMCCVDFDGQYVLGNVRQHRLQEIWNNEAYRTLRQEHLLRLEDNPLCSHCTLRLKDTPLWIKDIL